MTFDEALGRVLDAWRSAGPPADVASELDAVAADLAGPLRIAVVGRANAGKSTLLNAIVGERLAPTDATDCTRVVTEYHQHHGYEVEVVTTDGRAVAVPFVRTPDGVHVDLPADLPDGVEVARVRVGWPAVRLAGVTLVDTPGLDAAARADGAGAPPCDAVLYVLRDAHPLDAGYLDAVVGTRATSGQAVAAIAVLSRADELGAGSGDPFAVARALAERRLADPRLAGIVGEVLPVSGLLAEAAATADATDLAELRRLAGAAADPATWRSVDRLRRAARQAGEAGTADRVLDRFGLVGVQTVAGWLAAGGLDDVELVARLTEVSGLGQVREAVANRFGARAALLRGLRALGRLQALAAAAEPPVAVAAALERALVGAPELVERRLREVLDAAVEAGPLLDGARRVLLGEGVSDPDEIDRWRARAASPLLDAVERDVVDLTLRVLEARAAPD